MFERWLCSAVIVIAGMHTAQAADVPAVRAGVQCGFASGRDFPYSAGRDRCWEAINGKTLAPKTAIACAVQRSDGTLSVTFHFSELPNPECDNGKAATKEQYSRALPLLGPQERAFFLSHVGAR